MWIPVPSFRFEIENFWQKKDAISSKVFLAGGCEWHLYVYPKGRDPAEDHLSVYLCVANPTSLRTGWKRNVGFYFSVLNHLNVECRRSNVIQSKVLDAKELAWGFRNLYPLSQLKEKCSIEESLIIEVYIEVIKAVDGEGVLVLEKETVDINGFQVSTSHVALVRKIFAEHPDIALGFKPKNQVVKTAYMNVLVGLINRLNKPSQSHLETEIIVTQGELSELEEVGFKIDWLKSKLEKIFLERKKSDGPRVQQLEERVKNLEQMEEKMMNSLKRKVDEVFLERKKAKADEPPLVQKLEERVKNLEVMESGFRMDCLKSKLEDVSLEKKKSDGDADGSRVQKLEESVKNLEMMVSDLKGKLEEEKTKSSSDEFLLV